MAGTEVAVGYVSILPKMGSGFSKTVESALSSSGSSGAKSFSASLSSGVSSAGVAAGNMISSAISTAMSAVSSSLDSAISRVDTLNQFPKVMSNLGFSTEDADAALSKLSDGIQGLPTALDEIVGNTQTLSLTLGDLSRGTDVALALNDGMLTYGASSDQVSNAVYQLNQMISAGSYDLESWRSVIESAPGYMDQVAESCLGAGSSANDLREALNDGTVTTDQFLDAIVTLDQEGSDSVVAFSEQAKTATGGIATSFTNVKTAVTKNLANFIDAVNGTDGNISKIADSMKQVVNDIGSAALPLGEALGTVVAQLAEGFDGAWEGVESFASGVSELLFGCDEVVEGFEEVTGATEGTSQSAEELLGEYQTLFDQVWNGDWGDGEEARRQAFIDAGYSAEQYDAVQQLVNEHGADYVLTCEDLESVLGDVSSAQSKQESATKKATRVVKEATTGALTPYIDALRQTVLGVDEVCDSFDEFGTKTGEVTVHTDGLLDDLSQFWSSLTESLGSGAGLGEAIDVAVEFAFDFPEDVRAQISDACGALDDLSGKVSDTVSALTPSAVQLWESFSGMLGTLAQTSFEGLLGFFTQVSEPMGEVVGALGQLASDAMGDASSVFDAIADSAPTIQQTFTDALAAVFSNLADAFTAMQPAVSAIAGFITEAFVELVGEFAENCGDLTSPLEDASAAIKDIAETYGPKLQEFFEGLDVSAVTEPLSDFAAAVRDDLSKVVQDFTDNTLPKFQEAWDTITLALGERGLDDNNVLEDASSLAGTAFGTICTAATTALEVVGSLGVAIAKLFRGDWLGAAESAGSGVNAIVDGAAEELQNLTGIPLADWLDDLNDDLASLGVTAGTTTVSLQAFTSGWGTDLSDGGLAQTFNQFKQAAEDAGASTDALNQLNDALVADGYAAMNLNAEDVVAFGDALQAMRDGGYSAEADEIAGAFGITSEKLDEASAAVESAASAAGTTATEVTDAASQLEGATVVTQTLGTTAEGAGASLDSTGSAAQAAADTITSAMDSAQTSVDLTQDEFEALLQGGTDLDGGMVQLYDSSGTASTGLVTLGTNALSSAGQFGSMKAAIDNAAGSLSALVSYDGRIVTVNVVTAYSTTGTATSASSSVSATPSLVSAHAAGGITNGIHIVGEAGPEAILPLYPGAMDPFAAQVADFIEKGSGGGDTYNVRIDNAHVNEGDAINAATGAYIMQLKRLGAI